MTFIEFLLLVAVAGSAGVGVSSAFSSMIDRIGREAAPGRVSQRDVRNRS